MADDSDNQQILDDLAKYGIGTAGTLGANAATQAAYAAVLKNLQDRFGDYSNLQTPSYKPINPAMLGPSALSSIQPDAKSRVDQEAAEAALQDIANRGGLNLADKAALNEQEQTLSRNNAARGLSERNSLASRGQLGSGAEVAMSLANQQNAATNANQRGENIAGQAQQRAMQAILDKAGIAKGISADDYARAKAAAEATDAIKKYNASMSTDAQGANNRLLEQGYNDQLAKLKGESGLTGEMNTALLGSGKQNANTIAGLAYGGTGLVNSLGRSGRSGGSSSSPNDPGLDTSGTQDAMGNRGGAADLSGGGSLASDDAGAGFDDPEAWASFTG